MRNGVWSRCVKVSRRLIAKHFVSNCSQETKETKSLGWKYFLKHADTVSQCDFLRSWPTFASRDRLQPVCSRCRRRARCCLKDQKSQNLGILKEISKEIFAMSLSPWDPSPNRNAPAPSKSLQSSSRPAFRKHTVHKICQDMCNNDNLRQRTTTSNSLFSWGHRLGGMWSRRLRRRRLLFLPSPWSNEIPWETQFSEETNPSFEIFFHTNAIDFSEMLVCSNSQIQTKGWFDVSGLSHSLAFTNPNKLNLLISFLLCYDRSGVTFLQAWCDPATLGVQCPPRVHTNQTIAPEGHPPAAHLQSTSTLYICTYKNHQRTARPINNNDSIDVHIHVCTHKYFSICYAKRWNEFQCDAKPPRNPTRNPCVSPWRQFQCLHAGNQNLCRCQR